MSAVLFIIAVCALVWLFGAAWRALEVFLQGVVGGTKLFRRLAQPVVVWLWRAGRWAAHWGGVLQLELSRRIHAAYWVYSYLWHRQYIARHIRKKRRGRLAH